MSKEEPAMGIPCKQEQEQDPPLPRHYYYYSVDNPHQGGAVPPAAVFGDPKGIPIHQTIYRDTPAPFNCLFCGDSGLTTVRSKPSVAALVGCMMPMFMGICFLCPSMDCLWHKYHHCPACNEKVAEFHKSDPCVVMDPPRWIEHSFALPA